MPLLHLHKNNYDSATVKHFCLYSTKKHFISQSVPKNREIGSLVMEQLLISSSCLSPRTVKKLQNFINFCLKVGHSANLKHSKSTYEDNLSSYGSYKIITSKAMATMHAQLFFMAGTFGNDRSTTIVVLISGNLTSRLITKVGSLSNYDEDHDDDFKKTIGLMIKTTALRVHHAF